MRCGSRTSSLDPRMSDHLTPLDATFLELEQADEAAHMHIGGALVFDPRPDGSVPTVGDVCRHLNSRLSRLPRYRRKLSEPRTGGLRWPAWEDDERFHHHVTAVRHALHADHRARSTPVINP